MADRIYKGVLTFTPSEAFPESSDSFDKPHAGGLVPFQMLKEILSAARHEDDSDIPLYEEINGDIWLHGDGVWVRIEPDGTIEVGAAGV